MTSDVLTAQGPPSEQTSGATDSSRTSPLRAALRWESGLVLVLIAVLIFGSVKSTDFRSSTTFFYLGINTGYLAIMALPMTFIVMTGEIDLSVASMLGLSGSTVGFLWHHGWNIWACFAAALLVGAVGGALNGVLVARTGLPSIAVTIGTLTLFRGLSEALLGELTIPAGNDRPFPSGLTSIGTSPIQGTQLSYSMMLFLIMAVVAGVVLHLTPIGRSLHAIGLQPEAARFAGIRVNQIKFWLYVVSGVVCAFVGILFTLQNSSVSYNAGLGAELNVVAIVLFGGVSIFGGRGTIFGVVLSVLIIGALQMALTQLQVQAEVQNIITGALLLISVVIPNGSEALRRLRTRSRRPARTPTPTPGT